MAISSNEQYQKQGFSGIQENQTKFTGIEFNECKFTRCDFTECLFDRCNFVGCVFISCNLSVLKVTNSTFVDVEFRDCKAMGIDWTLAGGAKSVLPMSIKFHNTVLDYSGFFGLKLHKWEFVECIAHEVDFSDADLTDAKCMKTDFANSRFLHANLTRADFSQARNYAIDPTSATVKGAVFTLPEAISLLTGLGVVIDDPAFRLGGAKHLRDNSR